MALYLDTSLSLPLSEMIARWSSQDPITSGDEPFGIDETDHFKLRTFFFFVAIPQFDKFQMFYFLFAPDVLSHT